MYSARTMLRHFIILTTLLLVSSSSMAQRRSDTWIFGKNAGLRFSDTGVVAVRGALNTWEGSSVWCDPTTGELLLYTDGTTVWGGDGSVVATGLSGEYSSTQAALIVPEPGSKTTFYVFTTTGVELGNMQSVGTQYSVIELSRAGTPGAVVDLNRPLVAPGTEKLQAVKACDGSDYWILTHEAGSDRFMAFRLSSAGLDENPVVSRVGPALTDARAGAGSMILSNDGRTVAVLTAQARRTFLVSFDPCTGRFCCYDSLAAGRHDYGAAFSASDEFLYITDYSGTLRQIDLRSSPHTACKLFTGLPDLGALRLGPDGRLYIARDGDSILRVISEPEQSYCANPPGLDAVSLSGTSRLGLPNQAQDNSCPFNLRILASADSICPGSSATLSVYGAPRFFWLPSPDIACATCSSVVVSPQVTTTYRVALLDSVGCRRSEFARTVHVVDRMTFQTSTPTAVGTFPGEASELPLTIRLTDAATTVDRVSLHITYDPSFVQWQGVFRNGLATSRWWVTDSNHTPGDVSLTLMRFGQQRLDSGGRVAVGVFRAFVNSRLESTITTEVTIGDSSCSRTASAVTRITLDSLCGARYRLVEPATPAARLAPPRPDPVSGISPLHVTLFEPSDLTLELVDLAGNTSVIYSCESLESGEHYVGWDTRSVANGRYLLRMKSGGRASTAAVMVVN